MTERRRRPRSQRTLTEPQAIRAIYYDFEGRAVDDEPQVLLGACWSESPLDPESSLVFRQYVLDESLYPLLGLAPHLIRSTITRAVDELMLFSEIHNRHLVSWSNHDPDLIRAHTTHHAFGHRNAIATARRWRRGRTSLGPGMSEVDLEANRLQSYLDLIGYERPDEVRHGAGEWIATVRTRLEGAGGDVRRLSPGGREAWRRLVEHNRHDVVGLRRLMLIATGVEDPPAS